MISSEPLHPRMTHDFFRAIAPSYDSWFLQSHCTLVWLMIFIEQWKNTSSLTCTSPHSGEVFCLTFHFHGYNTREIICLTFHFHGYKYMRNYMFDFPLPWLQYMRNYMFDFPLPWLQYTRNYIQQIELNNQIISQHSLSFCVSNVKLDS